MSTVHGSPSGRDPRPVVTDAGLLQGGRCRTCGAALIYCPPFCPSCGANSIIPAPFGPAGVIWSSTVLRIGVDDRLPPITLAYVDIDDGPRLLAHLPAGVEDAPPPGARVRLMGCNEHGDPLVASDDSCHSSPGTGEA